MVCVGGGGGGAACVVVVCLGGGGGGGGGGALPPPPPNSHEPVNTPTSSDAKKSKSPREKSRPPKGHPGHYIS